MMHLSLKISLILASRLAQRRTWALKVRAKITSKQLSRLCRNFTAQGFSSKNLLEETKEFSKDFRRLRSKFRLRTYWRAKKTRTSCGPISALLFDTWRRLTRSWRTSPHIWRKWRLFCLEYSRFWKTLECGTLTHCAMGMQSQTTSCSGRSTLTLRTRMMKNWKI